MYFLDKRVRVICRELEGLCWKNRRPVTGWEYKKGFYLHPEEAEAGRPTSPKAVFGETVGTGQAVMADVSEGISRETVDFGQAVSAEASAGAPWEPFDCASMRWYGPDAHYWFRARMRVPEELEGKDVWFRIQPQVEEWDDAKNPQFLLFVNGEAVQGIDRNHREILLPREAVCGRELCLELQAYTGTKYDEFRLEAELGEVDPLITKVYYDLLTPLLAFSRMDKEDGNRLALERVLNEAVNLIDLRTPYSPEFYASLEEASGYLDKALYTDLAGWDEVIATCIGHTHIDVAWWWTVAQTREKVARSFSTVLKLMDEYPNYKFMSSQPQLYVFLKERYPELYEKLKMRVREKRWEPEGGMWLEADTNLTSGESLVRQFMHGKKFFWEEFGVDSRLLWLPDVFGYTGALPQIMKKCGIDYFMTTKLAWNQFNKVPYDTMRWRGIDGTEVLTHLVTTLDVGQPASKYFTTYNGMLHPDAVMGGWMRYQNKDINNDILVSYGYGDGGGGPTREMLEISSRMEKGIRGIPRVRQEFAGTYFDQLKERVWGSKRLPVWEGEFYFEYHRGTLTSMARNKRFNRKSELGLMDLELVSAMAARLPGHALPCPAREIWKLWEMVLLNQFHDILPGSAIHEVYEVTKAEYLQIGARIKELMEERLRALAGEGDCVMLLNTTGWERDDVVSLGKIGTPEEGSGSSVQSLYLEDARGLRFPCQRTAEGGTVAYVRGIPSKGYKTFHLVRGDEPASPFLLTDPYTLETPFYTAHLAENGELDRLYDKGCGREILQEGRHGNVLRMYEDKPMNYDNWDIDIYYTEKSWDVDRLERMEWTELGPVRAVLEIERKESRSRIWQKVIFYGDTGRIDFQTRVDWKEHQTLLKTYFPLAVHTDEATFEIQFGNLKRKTHTNTSWDVARFESCGQKWADLSEGHYGVSLLNDCKYGHSVKDGEIGLTLIKSGIMPNPTADQEMHEFTYALYPHREGWQAGGTVAEGYKLNQPLISVPGAAPVPDFSLASAEASNVVLETVKASEDERGVVLRLYESENSLTSTNLTVNLPFRRAWLCNLLEEEERELEVREGRIPVTLKPYEILTVKILDEEIGR